MSNTTAEQFLLGAGGKSAKFDAVGVQVSGTIAQPPQVRQQTHMETGAPLTWDNGDPRMQLVVQLQTTERADADDDGIRNLYVKGSKDPSSKSLHAAVAGAVAGSGAKGLEVGGTLSVTYVGDGVSKTRGFNPPKQYEATYVPPNASDFLGTTPATQPGAAQATSPVAPPASPTSSDPTPEQVAAVRAAGLDPATVFPGYTGG